MTIGEFWEKVTVICLRYDGKVISGPRSPKWNKEVGGVASSYHVDGLAADIQLRTDPDKADAAIHARKLGMWVQVKNNVIHVQPKEP